MGEVMTALVVIAGTLLVLIVIVVLLVKIFEAWDKWRLGLHEHHLASIEDIFEEERERAEILVEGYTRKLHPNPCSPEGMLPQNGPVKGILTVHEPVPPEGSTVLSYRARLGPETCPTCGRIFPNPGDPPP